MTPSVPPVSSTTSAAAWFVFASSSATASRRAAHRAALPPLESATRRPASRAVVQVSLVADDRRTRRPPPAEEHASTSRLDDRGVLLYTARLGARPASDPSQRVRLDGGAVTARIRGKSWPVYARPQHHLGERRAEVDEKKVTGPRARTQSVGRGHAREEEADQRRPGSPGSAASPADRPTLAHRRPQAWRDAEVAAWPRRARRWRAAPKRQEEHRGTSPERPPTAMAAAIEADRRALVGEHRALVGKDEAGASYRSCPGSLIRPL